MRGPLLGRSNRRRYRCYAKVENDTCQKLLREIWDLDWQYLSTHAGVPPNPYIKHWQVCASTAFNDRLLLQDHKVAIRLTKIVKERLNDSIEEIKDEVRKYYLLPGTTILQLTDEEVQKAIIFAIALWAHIYPDLSCPTSTLRDAVEHCVPLRTDPIRISGYLAYDLCMKHLSRKGGIDVEWTDRIESHLTYDRSTLKVFSNHSMLVALSHNPAMFVWSRCYTPRLTDNSDPFPTGFVDETLQTLYLLFRPFQSSKKRWNVRQMEKSRDVDLEFAAGEWKVLDLKQYPFWHERLTHLQLEYNKKTPSGIVQWWFDRRDRVQWATFWIAFTVFVLTVVFGMISSVAGILQAYVALRARP